MTQSVSMPGFPVNFQAGLPVVTANAISPGMPPNYQANLPLATTMVHAGGGRFQAVDGRNNSTTTVITQPQWNGQP